MSEESVESVHFHSVTTPEEPPSLNSSTIPPAVHASLSDEQRIEEAGKRKDAGNRHFQKQEYDDAIAEYTAAIDIAPQDYADRAVYLCNRAACFLKKASHEAVIADCTAALQLAPRYTKALLRRAQAHESLHHYSQAQVDYHAALELEPDNEVARTGHRRVPEAQTQYEEQQKAEAMAKLKELGNSFLGLFGMSVDQFRFQQDPVTGNYSVSTGNPASSSSNGNSGVAGSNSSSNSNANGP